MIYFSVELWRTSDATYGLRILNLEPVKKFFTGWIGPCEFTCCLTAHYRDSLFNIIRRSSSVSKPGKALVVFAHPHARLATCTRLVSIISWMLSGQYSIDATTTPYSVVKCTVQNQLSWRSYATVSRSFLPFNSIGDLIWFDMSHVQIGAAFQITRPSYLPDTAVSTSTTVMPYRLPATSISR